MPRKRAESKGPGVRPAPRTAKAAARARPARGKGARPKTKSSAARAAGNAGRPPARPAVAPPAADREAIVAGIGASAGGLDAFLQLFDAIPGETGMAFVLIQHMDPSKESMLREILARSVRMPVIEVTDGTRPAPDRIYVIPPNTNMTIEKGVLRLAPRVESPGPHMPVDCFFRSLAQDMGDRAIGIILSGTASDGSLGIRAIKVEGGITFAQDEKSARYPGMPASAVATGCVDFIMPPAKIAKELKRIADHPYVAWKPAFEEAKAEEIAAGGALDRIFAVLRDSPGVDFSNYKPATINRRILRRMALHKIETMPQYVRYLKDRPAERLVLFDDLLINVTSFFRDPEVFEILKSKVYPKFPRDRSAANPIRIWVPGCSTGEEVCSIAMSLLESLGDAATITPIQIFGTDLNERAIERARAGFYPENITQDVSPERIARFFVKSDRGYQIAKPIREMCVFARQNLFKDPPFSRLDLISCRNVLIYMKTSLQKKILPIFHYALKANGFLLLGTSETVGEYSSLFSTLDRRHKIFAKKLSLHRPPVDFGYPHHPEANRPAAAKAPGGGGVSLESLERDVDAVVVDRYAPPGVLVDENHDIIQFRGRTAPYLAPAPGAATLNLFKLLKEGLGPDVRVAIQKARKERLPVRKEDIAFNANGRTAKIAVDVYPICRLESKDLFYLVLFDDPFEPRPPRPDRPGPGRKKARRAPDSRPFGDAERQRLEQELQSTREYMVAAVEEHEATNEELRSANEEIQSANEELQSTNEELETAKEELQSINEELTTVNEELANRNDELAQSNNDLLNFLDSINVPIVMVGLDLRIRRFTVQAEKALNLIPSDIGRPIGDIKPSFNVPDLEGKLLEVIKTLQTVDLEVPGRDGRQYLLRIRPYKTSDHKIDGAVVTVLDIDQFAPARSRAEDDARVIRAAIDANREPLVILGGDLQVEMANEAFCRAFLVVREELEGKPFFGTAGGRWQIPRLREMVDDVRRKGARLTDAAVEHVFPGTSRRRMIVNASRIEAREGEHVRIILSIRESFDGREAGEER